MNTYIEANKKSWATLAQEHYQTFRTFLSRNESTLSETQKRELEDVNEKKLPELVVKYPYFRKSADKDEWIGGYACEPREATNYSWMYTIGEIVNALSQAGLHIEWLHEFDWLYYRLSAEKQIKDENGGWVFPEQKGRLPFTFSLKATIR